MDELKLRDDITRKDVMWFIALLAFLAIWAYIVFWSGYLV